MGHPMCKLIRTDGTIEEMIGPISMRDAATLIGATLLDTVALRHLGPPLQVMLVDDGGYETETIKHSAGHFEQRPVRALKPVNETATQLYLANCKPGTTHKIVGDVLIVPDSEF